MAIETIIKCDGCKNTIETDGTDSIAFLLDMHGWAFDPTTEEYQYCNHCLPIIIKEHSNESGAKS